MRSSSLLSLGCGIAFYYVVGLCYYSVGFKIKREFEWYVFLEMAATKITITLDDGQFDAIRECVGTGKASSVSGFVKHAVGLALFDAAGWQTMLSEALRQTGGRLTKAERKWADTLLYDPKGKKGARKNKAK